MLFRSIPEHQGSVLEARLGGAVLDNLLEPDRIKEGTSGAEQAALAGGECHMTRLELCCDLFTKLPQWSKVKQLRTTAA